VPTNREDRRKLERQISHERCLDSWRLRRHTLRSAWFCSVRTVLSRDRASRPGQRGREGVGWAREFERKVLEQKQVLSIAALSSCDFKVCLVSVVKTTKTFSDRT